VFLHFIFVPLLRRKEYRRPAFAGLNGRLKRSSFTLPALLLALLLGIQIAWYPLCRRSPSADKTRVLTAVRTRRLRNGFNSPHEIIPEYALTAAAFFFFILSSTAAGLQARRDFASAARFVDSFYPSSSFPSQECDPECSRMHLNLAYLRDSRDSRDTSEIYALRKHCRSRVIPRARALSKCHLLNLHPTVKVHRRGRIDRGLAIYLQGRYLRISTVPNLRAVIRADS